MLRVLTILLAAAAIGVGCSGDDGDADGSRAEGKRKKARVKAEAAVAESDAVFHYDPKGKPDPFQSYVKQLVSINQDEALQSPLQRFDLSQLNVTGIIWTNEEPRALVQDPTGKGYIVQTGAAIGKNRGRIVQIDDNRVVVKETYVDFDDRATTKEVDMYLYERNGG